VTRHRKSTDSRGLHRPRLSVLPRSRDGRLILLGIGVVAVCAVVVHQEHAKARTPVEVIALPERLPEPVRKRRTGRRVLQAIAALAVAAVLVAPWLVPGVARSFIDFVNGDRAAASAPSPVADPTVLPAPTFAPTTSVPTGPTPAQLRAWRRAAGTPTRVVVPRLQVSSAVLPISGNSGVLLPPSDPQEIGWWQEGRRAGAELGTTVLTGHTVHTGGGAFDHLDKLVVGDDVRVRTDKGDLRYRVTKVREYRTGSLARHARSIFRLTGPYRLLLITCSNWNGSIYLTNTVVTAVPDPLRS